MKDEELIAAMRDLSAGPSSYLQDVGNAAADRLEALVKELATSNEVGRAFEEDAGQQRARAERLEAALKGLVEHCELTRDTAGFWKPRQVHQLSPTQWQSWCKQIKSARAALTTEEPK